MLILLRDLNYGGRISRLCYLIPLLVQTVFIYMIYVIYYNISIISYKIIIISIIIINIEWPLIIIYEYIYLSNITIFNNLLYNIALLILLEVLLFMGFYWLYINNIIHSSYNNHINEVISYSLIDSINVNSNELCLISIIYNLLILLYVTLIIQMVHRYLISNFNNNSNYLRNISNFNNNSNYLRNISEMSVISYISKYICLLYISIRIYIYSLLSYLYKNMYELVSYLYKNMYNYINKSNKKIYICYISYINLVSISILYLCSYILKICTLLLIINIILLRNVSISLFILLSTIILLINELILILDYVNINMNNNNYFNKNKYMLIVNNMIEYINNSEFIKKLPILFSNCSIYKNNKEISSNNLSVRSLFLIFNELFSFINDIYINNGNKYIFIRFLNNDNILVYKITIRRIKGNYVISSISLVNKYKNKYNIINNKESILVLYEISINSSNIISEIILIINYKSIVDGNVIITNNKYILYNIDNSNNN